MADTLLNRTSTCLSCIRRLSNALGNSNATPVIVSLIQSRGKRTGRPKDQGVVVRLLEDMPSWGRKDSVFRVTRGRMRNTWYPNNWAEYMTASRFQALGLTRDDIGERDPSFRLGFPAPVEETTADAALATDDLVAAAKAKHLAPRKAHELLQAFVPSTITFYRKPIHPLPRAPTEAPKPAPAFSPLIARSDLLASTKPKEEPYDPSIFGSVTAEMIVADIKARLARDKDASRVILEPQHISFLGVGGGADRLKALGRWEIEISLVPQQSLKATQKAIEPVKRIIEILPEEEDVSEQATDKQTEASS